MEKNNRDPRIHPKAGDVTRNKNGEESRVTGISQGYVFYLCEGIELEVSMDEWRFFATNDEVIHVAE